MEKSKQSSLFLIVSSLLTCLIACVIIQFRSNDAEKPANKTEIQMETGESASDTGNHSLVDSAEEAEKLNYEFKGEMTCSEVKQDAGTAKTEAGENRLYPGDRSVVGDSF